jgi:hypothetical protein
MILTKNEVMENRDKIIDDFIANSDKQVWMQIEKKHEMKRLMLSLNKKMLRRIDYLKDRKIINKLERIAYLNKKIEYGVTIIHRSETETFKIVPIEFRQRKVKGGMIKGVREKGSKEENWIIDPNCNGSGEEFAKHIFKHHALLLEIDDLDTLNKIKRNILAYRSRFEHMNGNFRIRATVQTHMNPVFGKTHLVKFKLSKAKENE